MIAWSNVPARTPPDRDRRVIGYGSSGPIDADDLAERSQTSTVRLTLMQIADAQGDVDAFIAQYDARTRQVPNIAADIARRLCAAGRATEALQVIDAADRRRDRGEWPTFEWEDARIEVLDTLTRGDEAQADRWSCFERALSIPHLPGTRQLRARPAPPPRATHHRVRAHDDQRLLEQKMLRDHRSHATGATQLRGHDGQVK